MSKILIVEDEKSISTIIAFNLKKEGFETDEALDGITLERSRNGVWEYVIFKKGDRIYVTGLGCAPDEEPAYTSAYRKLDDGCIGTVMAANHFVEDILGYQFIYASYDEFPESPDLEMPTEYDYRFTREHMRTQRPKKIEGIPQLYVLLPILSLWGQMCFQDGYTAQVSAPRQQVYRTEQDLFLLQVSYRFCCPCYISYS